MNSAPDNAVDGGLPLRPAVEQAVRTLAEAGVDSPRVDAELLAAHLLGVPRGTLALLPRIGPAVVEELHALVARRAARVPLQHLTGTAPLGGIDLAVGPGVFVPRPETEALLEWGLARLAGVPSPLVVDLCTGSGALALAVAHARPDAEVHAVERDPAALAWARRNAAARAAAGDTPVTLHHGDVADPAVLADLDARAHLVLCNPPYVPAGAPVAPEVAHHDPAAAVFAGADGLDVIRPVVRAGARLLRAGGHIAIEHDDSQHEAVPALLAAAQSSILEAADPGSAGPGSPEPVFAEVADHADLAGRPRFSTALRAPRP